MQQVQFHIDQELCKGCKTCFDSCALDVIRWDDEKNIPIITYPEDCVWCLICVDSCPSQCIEIIPSLPWKEHPSC